MKRILEFARYCIVGGTAFIADFTVFFALSESLHFNYIAANTLGFLVGLLVNYLLSILWVFENRRHTNAILEFFVFSIIGVGGVGIGNSAMWFLVEHVGASRVHAKYTITLLVLIYNYGIRKYLLFRAPSQGG
jgi:putative flippase GtrA